MAFLSSSAVVIAPTWGCFHTASFMPQKHFRQIRYYKPPTLFHNQDSICLICDHFVGGCHKCRSLDGTDKLARPLHLLDSLLAGIGAELSDIPSGIAHALIIKKLCDWWQPKSIAVPKHVFIND